MSDKSAIEWTEATLNPWTGCTKVSPGCAHCYIDRTPPFRIHGRRFEGGHIPLVFHMERLERMVRRRKPTLYFVNSLSDLFHKDASDEQIARVFGAMAAAPQHTFQVLTKRPERMVELLNHPEFENVMRRASGEVGHALPLPNVWLGVSIENRRFVGRADLLRQTPAVVRFISAEPLLGPLVAPDAWLDIDDPDVPELPDWHDDYTGPELNLTGIDWVIIGGESGPSHRPMKIRWARDLRDACRDYSVACFVKQMGGHRPGSKLEDLPEDLRIRELPRA
jgi:protein gp37